MSSQEDVGKGVQGKAANKNPPVAPEAKTQQPPKQQKPKPKASLVTRAHAVDDKIRTRGDGLGVTQDGLPNPGRPKCSLRDVPTLPRKRRMLLTRKKGTGHSKCSVKVLEALAKGMPIDHIKKVSRKVKKSSSVSSDDKESDNCTGCGGGGVGSSSSGGGGDSSSGGGNGSGGGGDRDGDSDKDKEPKPENLESEEKSCGIEKSDSKEPPELVEMPGTMEIPTQSGDQKSKLLEMMSREFNSASIPEGSVPLDTKKSTRSPRYTRKRKSEVFDVPEKVSDTSATLPSPNATVTHTPIYHNPITSALKKIRKESLENLPSPASPATIGRPRKITHERQSISDKDLSEEATNIIPESSEVTESKTEEETVPEKATHGTRGRKRIRDKGKTFSDREEGNDSGNESPVIPVRGRGKSLSSSEEDSVATSIDSPSSSKSRAKNSKATSEGEAASAVGQTKGKGKLSIKDEPSNEVKGKSTKAKTDGDRIEGQQSVFTSSKARKVPKLSDEASSPATPITFPVGSMSTRSKVKTEPEKEPSEETESDTQEKESQIISTGDSTPQGEIKRSQRKVLSRDGSSDAPPSSKKGTPKPVTETTIKKPDTPTPPGKTPPSRPKNYDESMWTKTGKKKKKHFKGLSYSFKTKKKKVKGKPWSGKHSLDTSQETDSVVSEEMDLESVDSSSQDIPSEQLSNQNQDGVEERLSEGEEDNDVEMDNIEAADTTTDVARTTTDVARTTPYVIKTTTDVRNSTTDVDNTTTDDNASTTAYVIKTTTENKNTATYNTKTTTDVANTTTDFDNTATDITETTKDVTETTTDVTETTTDVTNTTTGVTETTTDVDNTTTDVDNTTTDVKISTTDVTNTTTTVVRNSTTDVIKTTTDFANTIDVAKIKTSTDITNNTTDVSNTTTDITKTTTDITNTTTDVNKTSTNVTNTAVYDTFSKKNSIENTSSDLPNPEKNNEPSIGAKTNVIESEIKVSEKETTEDSAKTMESEVTESKKEDNNTCDTKTESKQISNIEGNNTVSKRIPVLKHKPPPTPGIVSVKAELIMNPLKKTSVKRDSINEETSKENTSEDSETKLCVGTSIHTKILTKTIKTKKTVTSLPVVSLPSAHLSQAIHQKTAAEKEHPILTIKVFSTPDVSCSVSESAFSPRAESKVEMPEESGGEATKNKLKPPAEPSYKESPARVGETSDWYSPKPDATNQILPLTKKNPVLKVTDSDCRSALSSPANRDSLASYEEPFRPVGKRRQSISKKKYEDLPPEGHTSDSSDSVSNSRLSDEGVRKSKRLSRHSSPHGFAFAAPDSPEGAGREQSKPIGSQSANVTPASSGEHLCYSILSPPVILTQSCHQQGNALPAAPTLTNVLCKCRMKHNPLAIVNTGEVYCQAIDSFDGRMIGCSNVVSSNRLLRVSGKIPFMLLCDSHRQRLRQHNCCPCCGLFCTQGVFYECSWDKNGVRHYYHKLCSLIMNGITLCPHCGSSETPQEVNLELVVARKPVIYLKQHQERKESSARMTWSRKDAPEDMVETGVAATSEQSLELRNGRVISAAKLPLAYGREKLQDAIRIITEGNFHNTKPTHKGVHLACKHNDMEKLLQALVSGINPNVKVKECSGQTGLHVAAAHGSVAALHVLVMAGATIDMTDIQLMTPLMIAITKQQNDVVQYLVQAGASLMAKTQDGMTCLHLAAKGGNLTACQHILDSGRLTRHAINMQDEGGWTPLVWASENRLTHVVKFLLERGGNPQLCDVEQNTALHWAAFSGSTQICSMVMDRGCSLRSMNAYGDTPLHIAARQNHNDAVVLLLTRGAQLDVVNSKNQMPVDCALPDSDIALQLSLNSKILEIMKQNNIRTEKILSSDIAGGKEEVPIPCVNGVDEDELPKDYLYLAENCEASNVSIDRTITSLKWCECEDGCNAEHCGCGQLNFQCWFDPDGRLLPEFNYADPPMIFECNRACRCNKLSCNNRVVQHGISAHMQLFKTIGKGWGVRALKTIQKGSYVCEYVGEIITDLEADQRQDDSYLFDLDNRDSETFCIDARSYGNIARFINHLCEANLTPVKVFIDHQDLTFPRIALFANRDIEADEELGFDYGEKFWMIKYKQFTCTCNSDKCKYSSQTIHTTLENYNRKLRELQETMQ